MCYIESSLININGSLKVMAISIKFSLKKLITSIILLSLLFGPFANIVELYQMLTVGRFTDVSANLLLIVKSLKDVILLVLIMTGFIALLIKKKFVLNIYFFWFILFGITSLLISFFKVDIIFILSGIRCFLPLFLYFLLKDYVDEDLMKKITILMFILSIIAVFIQFIQLFTVNPILEAYGIANNGLNLRNPGFYLIPSSMAIFYIYTISLSIFFLNKSFLSNLFIYILFPLGIYLTASGLGLIAYFVILVLLLYNKLKQKFFLFPLFIVIILLTILFLPVISGRTNILNSPIARITIFFDFLFNFNYWVFSSSFGVYTNTASSIGNQLFKNSGFGGVIVDSTFNAIFGNLGLFALILFMMFYINAVYSKIKINFFFFIINILCMIPSIIFELYPINIILIVIIIYLEKNKKKSLLEKS